MYDRNVEYPNRYQLVKVEGTDDIFDLVPAPGRVDNDGTLINKNTLLKDATAALYGLGTESVPDDVLKKLSEAALVGVIPSVSRSEMTIGEVSIGQVINFEGTEMLCCASGYPTGGTKLFIKNTVTENTYPVTDNLGAANAFFSRFSSAFQSICVPVTIGSMSNVKCFNLSYKELGGTENNGDGTAIPYFDSNAKRATGVMYMTRTGSAPYYGYINADGSVMYASNSGNRNFRPVFVISDNTKVYLDADGRYYAEQKITPEQNILEDALGNILMVLPGTQIETGSYVGTGTYGESNPTSLTFGFEPKVVFIFGSASDSGFMIPWYWDNNMTASRFTVFYGNSVVQGGYGRKEGNTITLASTKSARQQFNDSSYTYYYTAIG